MRRPISTALAALVALVVVPASSIVHAQSSQYIAPGVFGRAPEEARAALRAAVDNARWRLGPVRVEPWIALREVAWVDSAEDELAGRDGDLTVAIGAGLRAYLPLGGRTVIAAHLLPEYVWWRERTDARRLAGRHGVGFFLHGARAGLEVTATASDLTTFLTPEIDSRGELDQRQVEAKLELPLSAKLGVAVRGGVAEIEARSLLDDDPFDFAALDREERWLDAGLRWRPTSRLMVGAGVGRQETEFAPGALRDRSNEGESTYVELGWNRAKLSASASWREQELEGEPGSELESFRGSTGSARLAWTPRAGFSLSLYGLRGLTYSVLAPDPYFLDERLGLEASVRVGQRLGLSAFREEGEHRAAGGERTDVTSTGGRVSVDVWRALRLDVGGRRTRGGIAGADRSTTELRLGVAFGGGQGEWY
jgi:hypothetical protein